MQNQPKSIFLTGDTGFVGINLISYFEKDFKIKSFSRELSFSITEDIVVHLAGKAHDLKKVVNSEEYYEVNTKLTEKVFDEFLKSEAQIFIFLSSIKAVVDSTKFAITEEYIANPGTHYGKSKLKAEEYILSKKIPSNKRFYILRPCMIHGPRNKGNLNLLYELITKRWPWPLGAFENQRSYCSIENLLFIIREIINNKKIPSGVYNIADDRPISTNKVIELIGLVTELKPKIYSFPKTLIKLIAKIGDFIHFPLNSERLDKLTQSYVVDNNKIKKALNKPLPMSSEDGLKNTFKSFYENEK